MEHIGPIIADMSSEDLDFDALRNLSFSFDRGIYEATYGEDHLRLVFTFAENFDAFDPGDTVPYNLFSIDSYVRNVVITWRGITYDEGPLFHLINGSIHFDGLQPAVRIGAEKLLFSMEYNGVRYIAQPGNLTDTLHTFVHSTPANVEWIATQLENDGYTLIFDSTRYASRYYDLDGVVEASQLNVRQRENTYWVDGRVSGRIVHDGRYYYYRGVYSNHGENIAEFSLTPAWDKLLGTSRQELDMRSGYFTSAAGDTLAYQLP